MADEFELSRRQFGSTALANLLAGWMGAVSPSLQAQEPANDDQPPAQPKPDHHLPADYRELFKLSAEQKVLISALVASGGDAVAYYTPGEKEGEFVINQQFDLYQANDTKFAESVQLTSRANTVFPKEGADGVMTHLIPVRAADGKPKGVVVVHESATKYDKEEPEYCRQAKRKMALDIVNEHADLFGASGKLLLQREEAHRSLEQKQKFFLQLSKDMFSTLTRQIQADPQIQPAVKNAKTADELKSALRKAENITDSDQYPHVLGVSDLMEHALKKAVNGDGDPAKRVMNDQQVDLLELLTLLHDVGKTQMPSQFLKPGADKDQDAKEFGTERNGSHPLFSLMTLLNYPQDGLDASLHHHGLRRYGDEDITRMRAKGEVRPEFNRFTELRGADVPPDQVPALARIMRVCDVCEAITGRADIPLHKAVEQLGAIGEPGDFYKKIRMGADGKPLVNHDSIDPDALCFLISNGVFHAYGEQRVAEANGWASKRKGEFEGKSKYNSEELTKVEAEILKTFGWDKAEVREQKEKEIRASIAADPILLDKGQQAEQGAGVKVLGR